MSSKLLTRDQFRTSVFKRDGHACVWCGAPAVDAHHVVERRLFSASHEVNGYFIDNGASVCADCHLLAEQTLVSCAQLREKCGITSIVLPEHLDPGDVYDKWGNPILPNGQRMQGELFEEEGVQKILAPVLHLFTSRVKYPRTFHVPWSPGATSDDKTLSDLSHFEGQEVVVTVKLDGENCTLYRDGLHARSLEYDAHASRDWVKALHARIAHEIPEGWRICGENLYAQHSIHYKYLASYFQVFSIWDGLRCLDWDTTCAYASMLGLKTVPVLYRGEWDKKLISNLCGPGAGAYNGDLLEGYVIRLASDFRYGAFKRSVAKYVRANHVTTSDHWKSQQVVPNGLERGLSK
jgi:hypothetical protein